MERLTDLELNEVERRIRFAERFPESGDVRLDARTARFLFDAEVGRRRKAEEDSCEREWGYTNKKLEDWNRRVAGISQRKSKRVTALRK